MEAGNSNRTITRWKKKPQHRSRILTISLLTLTFSLLFLLITYKPISNSLFPVPRTFQYNHQCGRLQQALDGGGEKFLWYAPHSGFSNQLSEFRNGVLMAAILNRTLIVPPVLDHHAVVLGSCPKFRVSEPRELRFSVWNHIIELVRSRR